MMPPENQDSAQQASPVRLGDLLTGAGLLKAEDLRQAMLIAKTQSLPVGRVLIMSGFIIEPHLQAAVQAQSMLKDGLIDLETALGSLRVISRDGLSLDQALSKMGWAQPVNQVTNKLGELLIEAGLVSRAQLEAALVQGDSTGLPLGRVLVTNGWLSEQLLSSALNAQILVRDRRVSRDQAISSLRAALERQVPIEQTLAETGVSLHLANETVRLGELLVMAKLLDEEKLMQAVELGLVNEQPIGQVLVKNGMVSETVLQTALAIQSMVTKGELRKVQCGRVLELVNTEKLSLAEAVERVQPTPPRETSNLPLYQFLQLAGVIGPPDIEEALKVGSRDTNLMGQMLMMTGAIDQNLLGIAMNCSSLMAQGILKTEQAVIVLGICWKSKATLEEAFKQLGWSSAIISSALPAANAAQAAQAQVQSLPVQQGTTAPQAVAPQPTAQGTTTSQNLVPQQGTVSTTNQAAVPPAPAASASNIGATSTTSQNILQQSRTGEHQAPKTSKLDQAISGRNRQGSSSATAHNLPAMPVGQNLTVEQGSLQPYDTGEMSPIRKKEEAEAAARAAQENTQDNPSQAGTEPPKPSGGPSVKKRLADLIP
ncbi:MAG: hypothetical protein QG574_4687 [Cyanobacteriota bacterium erpe_2018_sw_21hr_WHONDRS-SW48-000092_B_bin.40]|jgi:hypothetical protein|nr:hypothetical protein [Cyanobacteriota bacterium erpe_2018_sw_21hr_WHONDRS-SW48-000092_B_bin.40]